MELRFASPTRRCLSKATAKTQLPLGATLALKVAFQHSLKIYWHLSKPLGHRQAMYTQTHPHWVNLFRFDHHRPKLLKHEDSRTKIIQKKHVLYIYIYLGRCPLPVTVTTRIITFLIGNPYKPSFATVTGRGPHPIYIRINDRQVVYFPGRVEVVLYFFSTTSMAGRLDPQIPDTQKYRHHHVFGWLFFWQLSHDFKHESYSKRPI